MQMPNKSYRESVTLSVDSCYIYGKYKVEHVRMDLEDQTAEICKIILVFIAMVIVMTYVYQEVQERVRFIDDLFPNALKCWDHDPCGTRDYFLLLDLSWLFGLLQFLMLNRHDVKHLRLRFLTSESLSGVVLVACCFCLFSPRIVYAC